MSKLYKNQLQAFTHQNTIYETLFMKTTISSIDRI